MAGKRLFTIGHSNAPMDHFFDLLNRFGIQQVIDVRSAPWSRYVPEYNKIPIEKALQQAGFDYLFLGDRLGGKPDNAARLTENGMELYAAIGSSSAFRQGMELLLALLAQGRRCCLLCAEEDPYRCHRHHLLGRQLVGEHGVEVWHIRRDGSLDRAVGFADDLPRQLKLF